MALLGLLQFCAKKDYMQITHYKQLTFYSIKIMQKLPVFL